jgi:hypothetical protein
MLRAIIKTYSLAANLRRTARAHFLIAGFAAADIKVAFQFNPFTAT